jgi:hypothetical protein
MQSAIPEIPYMADWKQITARIRRARSGKDPAAQLTNLFEKTRDAMVAFELARHFETLGQAADAAKWYSTAAERFRRADWKTKAQEAATRLGAQPASGAAALPPTPIPEPAAPFVQTAEAFEVTVEAQPEPEVPSAQPQPPAKPPGVPGRRRRGRRGGRNRRKGGGSAREGVAAGGTLGTQRVESSETPPPDAAPESLEAPPTRVSEGPTLRLPVEPPADVGGAARRGRFGDPGLSSRLSLLEMQFRRLLTCAPVRLDEAGTAPAGPGVFLLTDSDLTTYYYVEACQTLRIAIPSLLRGGSSRRGADSIKPQLADHLGIAEARVGKYLAEHCVVRWLQLDEGASHFAHFVIAVLRPVLNE